MTGSANFSTLPHFSHLYIEEEAFAYPLAQRLIDRFPNAEIVRITGYRGIFTRPKQDFPLQKHSMKLIAAVKKDRFLYPGSGHSQGFGMENFFYSTPILNCVYNCDYCYLQGMYPSGNLVVFVNEEDFFAAARQTLAERVNPAQPLYLCLSYDTDLLAFERILPYCRSWIEFARRTPDLLIELRTKSAAYRSIADIQVSERVILAWTLSPAQTATRYEHGAPPSRRRIEAIRQAVTDGWPVRLCFDPVIDLPGWQRAYETLIDDVFARIDPMSVRDVTFGVFRMTASYFDRMKRRRPDTDLVYEPYERIDETVACPAERRQAIRDFMTERLCRYVPEERIAAWA